MTINGAEISTLLMACTDFSLWTSSVETMRDRASDVPFLPHLYAYTLLIWLFFGALGNCLLSAKIPTETKSYIARDVLKLKSNQQK